MEIFGGSNGVVEITKGAFGESVVIDGNREMHFEVSGEPSLHTFGETTPYGIEVMC